MVAGSPTVECDFACLCSFLAVTMWIQLAFAVQLLIVLVHTEDLTEASISSDGVNVVCKTPGGSGGFVIDGMDVVDIIKTLMVCRVASVLLLG